MNEEERIKLHGSIIHCAEMGNLCIYVDREGDGSCKLNECIVRTEEYQREQRKIEENCRRREAKKKGRKNEMPW